MVLWTHTPSSSSSFLALCNKSFPNFCSSTCAHWHLISINAAVCCPGLKPPAKDLAQLHIHVLSFCLSARVYLVCVSIAHRYRHARILWEQINKNRTQKLGKSQHWALEKEGKEKKERERNSAATATTAAAAPGPAGAKANRLQGNRSCKEQKVSPLAVLVDR